ncbi:MAG: DUF4339 domain-containing protein [Planctomycetaceae bacterium]|nr:DUF4339 domain-containing protein [Planctomycetaceae bacterium]
MGIKFLCPNGHKLHVKSFLASQRGVCPQCGEKFIVPAQSLPDIRVESLGAKNVPQGAAAATASPVKREARSATKTIGQSDLQAAANDSQAPLASDRPTPLESGPRAGVGAAASPSAPAAADPIAAAPTAQWYVRIATGDQFGPAQGTLMQRWLEEGRVAPDSLVWREGWAEWMTANKVFPQLRDEIGPPAVVPGSIAAFEQGLAEQVESLVLPAPTVTSDSAASSPAIDAGGKKTAVLDARRQSQGSRRLALWALLLAILGLFPVLVYVLWQQ